MGAKGGPFWRHITYRLPPKEPSPPVPQGTSTTAAAAAAPTSLPQPSLPPQPSSSSEAAGGGLATHTSNEPGHKASPSAPAAASVQARAQTAQTVQATPGESAAVTQGKAMATTADQQQQGPAAQPLPSPILLPPPAIASSSDSIKGTVIVEDAIGRQSVISSSFFDFLSEFLDAHRLGITQSAADELPFDFWCGLVGYLGFELKAECGGAHAHTPATPDASVFFADRMVAVDQLQGDVYALAVHSTDHTTHPQSPASSTQQSTEHPPPHIPNGMHEPQQLHHHQHHHHHYQQHHNQHQQLASNGLAPAPPQHCDSKHNTCTNGRTPGTKPGHSSAPTKGGTAPPDSTVYPTAESSHLCCGSGSSSSSASSSSGSSMRGSSSSREAACAWVEHTMAQMRLAVCEAGCGAPAHAQAHASTTHAQSTQRDCAATTAAQPSPAHAAQPSPAHAAQPSPPGCIDAVGTQATQQQKADASSQQHKSDASQRSDRSGCAPFRLRHNAERYMDNVRACKRALFEGESYEVCLTTALVRQGVPDPCMMYRTLRTLNPAPYGAWLHCGSSGPIICCSSPERFMRGGRGGVLEARPIKGTAPRVKGDAAADAAAAAALASSEKDRAENLMIVDLIRNDLGRVCEVGSVHVPHLMDIESYATVHQMVSTVRGVRHDKASAVDCVRAAFPGGSMTGAPKVRTMEIIDALEGGPRGVYSGSVGYISLNDTFDLNIVIRTAIIHPQQQQQQQQWQQQQAPAATQAQHTQKQDQHQHQTAAAQVQHAQEQVQQQYTHQGWDEIPRNSYEQQHKQQQQQKGANEQAQGQASWLSPRGTLQGCGAFLEGATMTIGAGGAIVVQSGIEEEYEEMRLKARALLAAVGRCDAACGKGSGQPAAVDDQESIL